jgi:hypothetical protein
MPAWLGSSPMRGSSAIPSSWGITCGRLTDRREVLGLLAALPHVPKVEHDEALAFLERHRLAARGLGWIDIHLLAGATLARASLWTLDRTLAAAATKLGLS